MFSQACVKNSVHGGGGVSAQRNAGIHPPGQTPPAPSTTGYGQQSDGTHPTGMHSYYCLQ